MDETAHTHIRIERASDRFVHIEQADAYTNQRNTFQRKSHVLDKFTDTVLTTDTRAHIREKVTKQTS